MQRTAIIHAEQMRLLYANAPAGLVATVVNVGLLALIQWPVIAPPRIVSWLTAMLALTALRTVVVWRFRRCSLAPPAMRRWGTLFGLGALGAGLGWGSAGVWLFPVTSLPHQVFLAFVVGGMLAGAVELLSARMGVFLSFACPAAVPIIVHLLAQDDLMSRTMGGMATLYTLVSIFTAWKLHCTIRLSLHLRFENTDLVAAVTAEKARVDASQRLEAEAEQRRREAEVLAELARTVNAALEMDTVLQRVTEGARELCDSDGAAIALCEPGAEAAVIRYWAGRSYRGFQGVRIEPGEGIGGLVLATGRPCRTNDYAHDPRVSPAYRAVTQAGGTVAVLVVPIHRGACLEGLLYVGSTRPRTFTDSDEAILQRLADHAAIALHNAWLYAAAERRRQSAESLAEVGHLLAQSLDAAEVGQRVVGHVRRLLQTRAAALYQLEAPAGTLVALAAAHDFGPAATPWYTLPLVMGVVGLAIRTRQPVVTADLLTDPRLTSPAAGRAGFDPTPIRAVLALPLLRDDRVIGALSLGDAAGRIFDAEALELARLFAAQATTALANAQLYTEVQAGRARLQRLSRQLLEVQEAERRRMAHELHDEAGQLLASVHLALETTVMRLPPPWREGFHQVRSQLDAMETQLRRLAHELRPTMLDDLGLLPALQFLAQGVAVRTGLDIHVDSALAGRLAPALETALYRIMQEGLTNIAKHAAATHVHLQVWHEDGTVHSLLRDDGVGFVVAQVVDRTGPRGLGLLGIQERLEALGGGRPDHLGPRTGHGPPDHAACRPWGSMPRGRARLSTTAAPSPRPCVLGHRAPLRPCSPPGQAWLRASSRISLMAVSGISLIAVSKRVRYPPCVGGTDAMRTTIVIVDDHAQVRTLMREIIAQEPSLHVMGEAEDGAEAMRLVQALRPDLMLLDLVMPQVNGLEALRWIKAARPETKIIIVTVHVEDAYRQAAEASGADAFLLKKTLVTILLPTIRRLCDSLAQ